MEQHDDFLVVASEMSISVQLPSTLCFISLPASGYLSCSVHSTAGRRKYVGVEWREKRSLEEKRRRTKRT